MTELLEHTSNNSIPSLLNSHLHPGGFIVRAKHCRISLNNTVREANARMQFIKNYLAHRPLDARLIDTLETESRMHQPLSHLPIIRQDHQSGRIIIEAPHRKI
jgi:hypothetical protein